ncbi:ATP-binding protein [Streptomyces chartreusis]|uniref:ATP-binding protein n=1 Tax=Streptomyces chartreusis TaxID=1969 RepID=UPI00365C817B
MTARATYDKSVPALVAVRPSGSPQPHTCEVWQLPGRSHWSPRAARIGVLDLCGSWGLAREITDDLAVIVSELTTNAVLHAPGDVVCVCVMLNSAEAHIVVVDHGGQGSPAEPTTDDEHGRGLFLVEALADRFKSMPTEEGTLAWATVTISETVADAPLPVPAAFAGHGLGCWAWLSLTQ